MLSMCVLYESLGSGVTQNILDSGFMGDGVLSICRCSLVL